MSVRNPRNISNGNYLPRLGSAGVNLPAVIRTFSEDGGCLAYRNWMTLVSDRLWPKARVQLLSTLRAIEAAHSSP